MPVTKLLSITVLAAVSAVLAGCGPPAEKPPEKTAVKLVVNNADGTPYTDKPGEKSMLRLYVDGGGGAFSDLPATGEGVYARNDASPVEVNKYWAVLVVVPKGKPETYRPIKDQPFELKTDTKEFTFQVSDAK